LNLKIPKMRSGRYFPGFLQPSKTMEKALVAVIQEAWINGVSIRKVDELVQAMGMTGISKSSVSKLCKDIDKRVNAFLRRPFRRVAIPVAGCDLSEDAPRRARRLGRGNDHRRR
jgi:transposase-like protein